MTTPATEFSDRQQATVDVEVRYAETDQMGVVHHSNYFVWFELARTDLCRATGFHYAEIEAMGYFLVVSRTETRYGQGARYGDTVRVQCWIEKMTSRGLRFGYRVTCQDKRLADGATEHIWVRIADRRPCRIPSQLEDPFRRLVNQAG